VKKIKKQWVVAVVMFRRAAHVGSRVAAKVGTMTVNIIARNPSINIGKTAVVLNVLMVCYCVIRRLRSDIPCDGDSRGELLWA
jgi:hypothetical protein